MGTRTRTRSSPRGLALAVALVAAIAPAPSAAGSESTAARERLVALLEDVEGADLAAFHATDDDGRTLDTLKAIPSPAGGWLGVYHVRRDDWFEVRLAVSTDLRRWMHRATLTTNGAQPTIAALPGAGYAVAHERLAGDGTIGLRFARYPTLAHLLAGAASDEQGVPRLLSRFEGTPSVEGVAAGALGEAPTLEVGFHYWDRALGADRNARGTLAAFSGWSAAPADELNSAFSPPPAGNIGDRDSIVFEGHRFTLIEAQTASAGWAGWRVHLYDHEARVLTPLEPATPGGSVAFGNPTATLGRDALGRPQLVVTMFLFSEGAAPGEAGPLVYAKRL